jgi:hypothetical protein
MSHSFLHSHEAQANLGSFLSDFLSRGGKSSAFICNFQKERLRILHHPDSHDRTPRVPLDVSEAFLHNTEQGCLHISRQAVEAVWQIEIHPDSAAPGKTLRVPPESRSQAVLVQRGGVQEIGEVANFLHTSIGELEAFGNDFASLWVKRTGIHVHPRQVHGQSGQVLSRAVVKFLSDTSPLIILSAKQLRG